MKTRLIILAMCMLAGAVASAHDFSATIDGKRLYFEITSKVKKTVAVTFGGSAADRKAPETEGTVEIPAKVKHNNVVYQVDAIGAKAFAGAARLKGVVIPSGVESIGDFAFEGCDSLTNVVFPGNPVKFGQGVFFNCPCVSAVTIGSDWKAVDLTMFRWSKELKSIAIPAKVEKIQGLKKLKCLAEVSVDANNAKFSSADGLLYSKDGSVLYACPRAYSGKVTVNEGTAKVLDGALIDCTGVTTIDLPASLREVSFRETSRMPGLEYIAMRGDKPIFTGYIGGSGKFLFQIANPKAQIIVPAAAKPFYEIVLADEPGEYSEKRDGVPYMVTASELPTKKSIKGVKNFEKY